MTDKASTCDDVLFLLYGREKYIFVIYEDLCWERTLIKGSKVSYESGKFENFRDKRNWMKRIKSSASTVNFSPCNFTKDWP